MAGFCAGLARLFSPYEAPQPGRPPGGGWGAGGFDHWLGRLHLPAPLLSGSGRAVFAELLLAAAFGLLLIQTRTLNDWIHRSKIGLGLHFLGKISYSLYLVNQFNLTLVIGITAMILPTSAPFLVKIPLVLGLHILIATVFWYFCERPFLNEPIIDQPTQVAPKLEPVPVCAKLAEPPRDSGEN